MTILVMFVLLVGFAVTAFLLYRGFQILVEDLKLTRLQMQTAQKELMTSLENFHIDMSFVLGGDIGENLKKYLKKLDKDYAIVNGKVVKVDHDY